MSKKNMTTNEQKIQCPKCGESISIDDVLTRQIEEKIKKDFEAAQKMREDKLEQKSEELKKQAAEIAESKNNIESVVAEKVAGQLSAAKLKLFKEARAEAEKEQDAKTALLEEQLKNKDEKLTQATKNEVELRKDKIKLEEDKQAFELEKMRQMEEAKRAIVEEATKKAAEEQQYVIAQLKKKLTDATKVKDRSGRECGQIVWESKKTKAWSEGWIQKLKDDQRAIKADVAVIVSVVLPEDVKGFLFRDGVWICDIKLAVALATALRINLESLTREKAISVGKNEKMEVLYSYLTGVEFKQRVEAIVEAFTSMDEGLRKERMAYEKIWSEREKQIKKVMNNTIGMYGDLSGLVTLPQIKTL